MANPEHLAILQQGVAAWDAWRRENPDVRPDLSEEILYVPDLLWPYLRKANLHRPYLREANLSGADLSGTILYRADLSGADLREANLSGADLSGADLREANLSGAILYRADLREANLSGADLSGAILREANLSGAILYRADLSGADLSGTILYKADLSGAILYRVKLDEAPLFGARLGGANYESIPFKVLERRLRQIDERLREEKINAPPELSLEREELRNEIERRLQESKKDLSTVRESIPRWMLTERLRRLGERLSKLVVARPLSVPSRSRHEVSILHSRWFSKRYDSLLDVRLYASGKREAVEKAMAPRQIKEPVSEVREDMGLLSLGQKVTVQLASNDLDFRPERVQVTLDQEITTTHFVAKPKDSCSQGSHPIIFNVLDTSTGAQIKSFSFVVRVADFAFDHVSRPFLSKASSLVLGIGSLASFALTMLDKIDTAFGIPAGTAVAALSILSFAYFVREFQQKRLTTPTP